MLNIKKILTISIFYLLPFLAYCQNYTLSGYVKESASGETLIGANVYNNEKRSQGTATNSYGFYSLTLPKGKYKIVFSYTGFQDQNKEIDLSSDLNININLTEGVVYQEVTVLAERKDKNVSGTQMGTVTLPIESIKKIPALMGEVDILKVIQLLPGVRSAGEGGSGFYVRGGGPDQNLILLDEATVYNSGHLLGFFSVFNADAIKNTTLIKGGMPAQYGGRLSSVLDIQMKDGNNQNFKAAGGVGLISSRLTLEGPLKKNVSSFILSARRTYALDLAQPYIKTTNFAGTNYYFYDFYAKINYKLSDKDRLFMSGYFGRDVLQYNSTKRGFSIALPYGNATATARWNHLFSNKLFMNTSLIFNNYDFSLTAGQENFSLTFASGIRDLNAKVDFDYLPNPKQTIKYGINYTYHTFVPGVFNAKSGKVEFTNSKKNKYAHEAAFYLDDDWKASDRLTLNLGLRYSIFSQVGPYTSKITGQDFTGTQSVKTYGGLEPRALLKYTLTENSSVKGGITTNYQYVHLVSNSTSTLPGDLWVPSTELVKPQKAIQYALGYYKNFKDNVYETSVEVYYKDMFNQLDYSEDYVPNAAKDEEQNFVSGTGRSYGAEFFLKKAKGRLNGWIGYTLSKTERKFESINNNIWYPLTFDRRHDLSVIANYQLTKKWDASAVFVYSTGRAYTPIKAVYLIGTAEGNAQPNVLYGQRNSARLEPYHRMDLSTTYTPHPDSKKNWKGSWTFAIYNTYNNLNTFFTYYNFETNKDTKATKASAFKVTIFPIIPSITYNFKWR